MTNQNKQELETYKIRANNELKNQESLLREQLAEYYANQLQKEKDDMTNRNKQELETYKIQANNELKNQESLLR